MTPLLIIRKALPDFGFFFRKYSRKHKQLYFTIEQFEIRIQFNALQIANPFEVKVVQKLLKTTCITIGYDLL